MVFKMLHAGLFLVGHRRAEKIKSRQPSTRHGGAPGLTIREKIVKSEP